MLTSVNAPNVIIPIEHQAAPNVPVLRNAMLPAVAKSSGKDYDAEMDHPLYHHPDVLAWEQREPGKSTDGMVEEALKQHALTTERMKTYQWQGQERWQGRENEEARLVRILHPHAFIACLQRAGVAAALANSHCDAQRRDGVAEPLDDGNCRVWLNEFARAGRVGLNAWVKPEAGTVEWAMGRRVARTVTTLQYPYGPEYSVMRFNEWNVPTAEKYRGWRTALLTLILTGVVSEAEAARAFGPAIGAAGEFYRQQLYQHRAMKLGVTQQ